MKSLLTCIFIKVWKVSMSKHCWAASTKKFSFCPTKSDFQIAIGAKRTCYITELISTSDSIYRTCQIYNIDTSIKSIYMQRGSVSGTCPMKIDACLTVSRHARDYATYYLPWYLAHLAAANCCNTGFCCSSSNI